jgi:hypothetical protein
MFYEGSGYVDSDAEVGLPVAWEEVLRGGDICHK